MSSLRSCPVSGNVSFPLRNSISDVKSYYKKINQTKANISATFGGRNNNPVFKDETRITGGIDEQKESIVITYNDNIYNLISVELCLSTHTSWLPVTNLSKPPINIIDIIITLENSSSDPRFVIVVLPLITDDTITNDNSYLKGLSYLNELNAYSLSTLFVGLDDYFYYITCLEPHGDNAFVYVNTDGLKISQNLYSSLLAVWTNQNLSTVQQNALDATSPLKKIVQNYCQNITSLTDAGQIQNQLNNMQAITQVPTVNPSLDTWPRYVPPYDIVLNVPGKIITATTVETFQNMEEGFTLGATSSGSLVSAPVVVTLDTSGGELVDVSYNGVDYYLANKSSVSIPIGNMQCVPLDLDSSLNNDGTINFYGKNGVSLGNIQAARDATRAAAGVKSSNNLSFPDIATKGAIAISIIIGILILTVLIKVGYSYVFIKSHPTEQLPAFIKDLGTHTIILIIVGFAGFLVGAAVMG